MYRVDSAAVMRLSRLCGYEPGELGSAETVTRDNICMEMRTRKWWNRAVVTAAVRRFEAVSVPYRGYGSRFDMSGQIAHMRVPAIYAPPIIAVVERESVRYAPA